MRPRRPVAVRVRSRRFDGATLQATRDIFRVASHIREPEEQSVSPRVRYSACLQPLAVAILAPVTTANPRDSSPAMRPCLLVNPDSFRASRMGLAARATRMARAANLAVHVVRDPPSLYARLDQLRLQGAQQLWLLSGDGTILALAEYLAERAPDWTPALLLLAGGRANIVPRDVGGYPAMRALRRALAALRAGRSLPEESICTLRVTQDGLSARYGFVWAGALVHEAVRLTAANRAAG